MVGDLEHVDTGESPGEEDRVDAFLDVAGEQEAPLAYLAEEDDRDVVDAGAGVGWLTRDRRPIGPQHPKADVVEGEAVAGR